MGKPVAISMGAGGFWGTCGNTDNGQNDETNPTDGTDGTGNLFMGPALFTTDRSIFATQNPVTHLGSHFDMLHNTPFCRGLAWERDNIYWAFNAFDKTIDKYNFNKPHEKGGDDHSDGEIYKYVTGQVLGAEDNVTPSHLIFDPSDSFLYIADTGHQRIVKLDTTKGTKTGELPRRNEVLKASGVMGGVDLEEVVPAGALQKPSGIELRNDLLYVTDTATSTFHVFRKDGTEVRKLETDLPPGALAGFTFGADGKIWFVDRVGGRVLRIDPK
jgi:DNA-binding beta-propeller fold protein YncE